MTYKAPKTPSLRKLQPAAVTMLTTRWARACANPQDWCWQQIKDAARATNRRVDDVAKHWGLK